MNLQLTGYRATGKTSVADEIGRLSGWIAVDTDALIEQQSGTTIEKIFTSHGEAEFRRLESLVIQQVAKRSKCIVSLGGGAILSDENRAHLKAGGQAVWLRASVETIHNRMVSDPRSADNRPSLTNQGPLQEIADVLTAREPIYREFADWVIDTDDLQPAQIAARIWKWFRPQAGL